MIKLLFFLYHNTTVKEIVVFQSSSVISSAGDDLNLIHVYLEIKSNWGHNMRLGLTEIQLFDGAGTLIPVSPNDVSVHGAEDCKEHVSVLFNGKFKVILKSEIMQ